MPARLTVISGRDIDQVYTLEDGQVSVLGRSIKSDIRIPDGRASRRHCRIEQVGGDWIITDEGQKQIRDQLQARMRVQIRRIGGS